MRGVHARQTARRLLTALLCAAACAGCPRPPAALDGAWTLEAVYASTEGGPTYRERWVFRFYVDEELTWNKNGLTGWADYNYRHGRDQVEIDDVFVFYDRDGAPIESWRLACTLDFTGGRLEGPFRLWLETGTPYPAAYEGTLAGRPMK